MRGKTNYMEYNGIFRDCDSCPCLQTEQPISTATRYYTDEKNTNTVYTEKALYTTVYRMQSMKNPLWSQVE